MENALRDNQSSLSAKERREEIKAEEMPVKEYDDYFDETYACQCDEGSKLIKVPSIATWADWAKKSTGGYLSRMGNAAVTAANSTLGRMQARRMV